LRGELLGKEITQQGWRCYAYCLMNNHYHLLRARAVKRAENWAWSSYRATTGQVAAPAWLDADWVLGQFGGRNQAAAYERFVA